MQRSPHPIAGRDGPRDSHQAAGPQALPPHLHLPHGHLPRPSSLAGQLQSTLVAGGAQGGQASSLPLFRLYHFLGPFASPPLPCRELAPRPGQPSATSPSPCPPSVTTVAGTLQQSGNCCVVPAHSLNVAPGTVARWRAAPRESPASKVLSNDRALEGQTPPQPKAEVRAGGGVFWAASQQDSPSQGQGQTWSRTLEGVSRGHIGTIGAATQ